MPERARLPRLSIRQWGLVAELALTTMMVTVAQRRRTAVASGDTALGAAHPAPAAGSATLNPSAAVDELCRLAAGLFRRWPLPLTCLTRSLVLTRALARRGLRPALKIGVAPPTGAFTAHAWVECDGRILLDEPDAVAAYRTAWTAAR